MNDKCKTSLGLLSRELLYPLSTWLINESEIWVSKKSYVGPPDPLTGGSVFEQVVNGSKKYILVLI